MAPLLSPLVLLWTALGCGDSCQQLCRSIADRIETCIDDGSALAWVDVRADDRDDFVDLCQLEWDDERRLLSSFDRQAALQECCDAVPLFDEGGRVFLGCDNSTEVLTCDEVVALYGSSP
ncbi:MAG: hypothetical protein AAF211_06060 [Myxococcota bacterium]